MSEATSVVDRSVCAVCGSPAEAIMRSLPSGSVCMLCNPFRRCNCLGLFVNKPLPNDMGRMVCNKCGKKTRS